MTREGRQGIVEPMREGGPPIAGREFSHQEKVWEGSLRRRKGPMLGPMGYGGEVIPRYLTFASST